MSWADQPTPKQSFVFNELSVPRRPAWDESTTKQELDKKEKEAFLEWRRAIAAQEEILDGQARVTPFEKNLEVWRQLWRVLERSSCILQMVDARNPLFYLSEDLRDYATKELDTPMLLLVNKSDFLSAQQRREWHEYLKKEGWNHLFFSAHLEQAKLDEAASTERKQQEASVHDLVGDENKQQEEVAVDSQSTLQQSNNDKDKNIGIETPLTRLELLEWLKDFAVQHDCEPDPRYDNRIQFGTVGFPNVGKSSVINVLMGNAKHAHGVVRVGVAAQPGKTKHFQTLLLPDRDDVMLCDCPGLVFPSFVSNTADLIAAGVYPIAQMRDFWPVVQLICQRIPREILNAHYGIHLPVPTAQELKERGLTSMPPPAAEELLEKYCVARSMYATASGEPDFQRASRIVIKDYADGKLLYCHAPPPVMDGTAAVLDDADFQRETILTALQNTKKLKDKLSPLLDQATEGNTSDSIDEHDDGEPDEDIAVEDDLDLLELVGGQADRGKTNANGGKRGKAHKSRQKHGRKGRKDRNKDPYGCHSTPDDVLDPSARASSGLVVNGKYGHKKYTRPTSYAGPRAASQPGMSVP